MRIRRPKSARWMASFHFAAEPQIARAVFASRARVAAFVALALWRRRKWIWPARPAPGRCRRSSSAPESIIAAPPAPSADRPVPTCHLNRPSPVARLDRISEERTGAPNLFELLAATAHLHAPDADFGPMKTVGDRLARRQIIVVLVWRRPALFLAHKRP
jgi:hypothetical protein